MAARKQRRRVGRRNTVTVYTKDGMPVQYPKSQVDRLADSDNFFTENPMLTEVDKPEPKPKKKAASK